MIREEIEALLDEALGKQGGGVLNTRGSVLEHPSSLSHGDYATSVALVIARKKGVPALEFAKLVASSFQKNELVESVSVADPGFINIRLSKKGIGTAISTIDDNFGKNENRNGMREMYEYTDPNPFKVFHIGHMMSNTIGESLSRLAEQSGAKVVRANYQGDVGLHVAKAIYGMKNTIDRMPGELATLSEKTRWLGDAYVVGAKHYEDDKSAKEEIDILNKKIFEKSDEEINKLYEKGREWSLSHFEEIYKKLGTKFDHYFFESDVAGRGIEIVKDGESKGVFKESDGAMVFEGEKHGLHTRVFLNGAGLPTYETKDLGLNVSKFATVEDLDVSVIITANEQNEYFKVMLKALSFSHPEVSNKTRHMGHGMMLGTNGKKMSSRTGEVITGEGLLLEMEELARIKVRLTNINADEEEEEMIATRVAVAAIKYSVLKQQIGKNIVFDREKALSFEGDSGPYLLYTYARAKSVLRKGESEGILTDSGMPKDWQLTELERKLYWLPEIIERATDETSPNLVATYLIDVAQTFNTYYSNTKLVDSEDHASPYKLYLTKALSHVLKNGLYALGIETVERM
ncbi:MAG: arginine--tRNA ligase [Candidatus Vogelbacteria bacterium CG10_big_fil_rev_8_21_14_0_10_45_14]|uniref:Arginine--tRNA ligase n=1 Tax=Candidatus Vogelbacteria bacterium CG10_big_fil_rev_8_21_14_0_10_45_14 TaxID=1975042 RepID=A0A2H0RM26_9BACT|nr:MAG: arginine--tRNA ligase [Candidatus Vogelbacteria bacterium CG10_big_fil_rev_8_21_14_0_10_45_14]